MRDGLTSHWPGMRLVTAGCGGTGYAERGVELVSDCVILMAISRYLRLWAILRRPVSTCDATSRSAGPSHLHPLAPSAPPGKRSGVPPYEWPLLFAIFLDLVGFGITFPDVQLRAQDEGAP